MQLLLQWVLSVLRSGTKIQFSILYAESHLASCMSKRKSLPSNGVKVYKNAKYDYQCHCNTFMYFVF